MDNRPIGVFDSGVGGLTVLSEIIKILPGEDIIYFGDTARFPYGPRSLEEVRRFVFKIAEFLSGKNVKMMVVACNTSTAAALQDLELKYYPMPVIGVIEPGARTAVKNTHNKRIGLIATRGTVQSKAYEIAINNLSKDMALFSYEAPRLVEYIEAGLLEGRELKSTIQGYINPLAEKDIDVLILGCTHFPLIQGQITACCDRGMKVINSAVETAKDVKDTIIRLGLEQDLNKGGSQNENGGRKIFYETGSKSKFLEVGRMFLGREISEVIKVNLGI